MLGLFFAHFNRNARTEIPSQDKKKAKRFAKQLLSNVINALPRVHCYFLQAEFNGYQKEREEAIVLFC